MDDSNANLAANHIVSSRYVDVGMENIQSTRKLVGILLANRKIPEDGWDESTIECFLRDIARMDSNNFVGNTGVGEREGRVVCPMVSRRHFYLAHGIGRSGDVAAEQPKAAGSSILHKVVRYLALDAIRMCGIKRANACLVLPMATGMSFALILQTLRRMRGPKAKYVVWSRCDQKSCFKAILSAGLTPVVVETRLVGDAVCTDMDELRAAIERCGEENVLCVASTTSCFAPRTADDVPGIALECAKRKIPHVCNNAYGLQSSRCCHLINEALRVGRLDAFVQSTDKNFRVPVGGAIVSSSSVSFVEEVGKSYAGRASISPLLDLLITLLYQGRKRFQRDIKDRKTLGDAMRVRFSALAAKHGERVLNIPKNSISMAMTLSTLAPPEAGAKAQAQLETMLGAQLFRKRVSGVRVVPQGVTKTIEPYRFVGFGASVVDFPCPYLTAACAIGTTQADVDLFLKRLDRTLKDLKKRLAKEYKKRKGLGGGRGKEESSSSSSTPLDAAHVEPTSSGTRKGVSTKEGSEALVGP
eukprot:g1540.t1